MIRFSRVLSTVFRERIFLMASFFCGITDEKKSKSNAIEEVVHNITLATIALKDGDIEKSGNMLLKTLTFSEINNLSTGVVSACDMLSTLAVKLGDYQGAEILLLKALDNLSSQGAPEDDNYMVSFNLKLSKIYSRNGNDDLAESGFKRCLEIQKKKLNSNIDEETFLLWTTILYWYGKFLIGKNRFEEAKAHLKDCYSSSLKVEDMQPNKIMVILYNLGEVCEILGEHDEAVHHFLEGVSLDKNCKNPDLTYFYSKLGEISMCKGLYKEARVWCDEARKFAVKHRNPVAEKESNECLKKLNAVLLSN